MAIGAVWGTIGAHGVVDGIQHDRSLWHIGLYAVSVLISVGVFIYGFREWRSVDTDK